MASDDLTICHVDTLWYIQRIFESGKTYKLVAFLHDLFPTDLKGNFQATPSIENFLCPLVATQSMHPKERSMTH